MSGQLAGGPRIATIRVMIKRSGVVGSLLFAVAFTASGCDQQPTPDTDPVSNPAVLTTVTRPTPSSSEAVTTVVEPPTDPGVEPVEYDRMCRHYCGMLVDTLLFNCVASGLDIVACRDRNAAFTVDWCFELRCAPRLLTQPTCFKQCDSLAAPYSVACSTITPANESACTSSPAEHDRACREGCTTRPTP